MSEKIIKSYKAFNKNMQCRGFQYEVGKEYNIDGNIAYCRHGFHACKSPMETAVVGFLGCANREIARHLGKYFGMLITEAKYGDMVDFEIISGY